MLRVAQWHTAVAQLWVFTQCSVWAQRGSGRFPAPGGDILQCNNYESKIDLLKYIKLSRNFPFLSTFCSIEFNSSTFSADYPPLLPVPFSWDQWGELGSASALGYWALSPWQYPGETGHQWSPVISIYQNLKQLPQWGIYSFTNKSKRLNPTDVYQSLLYHWIHFSCDTISQLRSLSHLHSTLLNSENPLCRKWKLCWQQQVISKKKWYSQVCGKNEKIEVERKGFLFSVVRRVMKVTREHEWGKLAERFAQIEFNNSQLLQDD